MRPALETVCRLSARLGDERRAFCHAAVSKSQNGVPLRVLASPFEHHPENTHAQVHRWTGPNHLRLASKGARARHKAIEDRFHHAPSCAWLDGFLRRSSPSSPLLNELLVDS